VSVDQDLVRRLLQDQHPDLAGLALRPVDAGWDNVMWRLGERLAVRVPRRLVAAPLIVNEQRWLPELAPRLPLAVPVPVRVGSPSAYYPWYWSVVPWLEGEPGDRARLTQIGTTAERLGSFLGHMHQPAPPDAPHNPYRSGSIGSRSDAFEERLARLGPQVPAAALRRMWTHAVAAAPHEGPAVWLHGDLHPANTLVDGGVIVGVIDFGDLCAGDPACDLGAAWLSLPEPTDGRFWAAYGPAHPDLVRRSYGWAVLFALMLLEIGLQDRPTYAEVGRTALDRMMAMAAGAG
jgi:aminoglycoside phosphotransferase (APT) family kinase protein